MYTRFLKSKSRARLVKMLGLQDSGPKAGRKPNLIHHACGGCRMATKPSDGVCDSWGRTFDHENLFITGLPAMVSPGCTHNTMTVAALAVRCADQIAAQLPQRKGDVAAA